MARSGYDLYLDKCLLPVTPEKVEIKINNTNKKVTLINQGEINILKKAGLTDIVLEVDIPQVKHPYAVYKSGFKSADHFLDYFESLKTSQKAFQFILCRRLPSGKTLFNTNMKVGMEDYKIIEEASNGFDLRVKINLKQWKSYGTKTVNVVVAENAATATVEKTRETTNSPAPAATKKHTVVSGDTLWGIAKYYYGNGSKYNAIYNANKGVIGGNPNLIYPGQVLTIPAL